MNRLTTILAVLSLSAALLLMNGQVFAADECGPSNPLACRPAPQSKSGAAPQVKGTLLIGAATGYCSSVGGSTEYENISSVSVVQNQDKLTITVNVYIANPTGCASGSPCPEYDNSPEYVNVWIDFDGDGTWESQEKVMNEAGTGYLNINYHGTMTFIETVTIPIGAVADIQLRANLGWGYDPENPCENSWTWGNVVDQAIHIETKTPEIEDITISPTNPETTKDVTFTAKLKNMDGYEVVKIAWSGDVQSGEGNPSYTVKPAAGTHGKDKNVTATLTYKKTGTQQTGTHSKSKKFDLFFVKLQNASTMADDDADGTANWYEYWSSSRDGACTFNASSSMMHYGGGGPNHGTRGEYWSGNIRLYDSAAMNCSFLSHAPAGITINQQGIDCVEVVLRHEQEHGNVDNRWGPGGAWHGLADSDNDELPNTVEQGLTGFNPNNANSFPGFCCGDDEEVYNTQIAQNRTGTATNDRANPGKNSNPSYLREIIETGTSANISGTYADWPYDTDGDGHAEYLALAVGLNVQSPGTYRVFANLYDSKGNMIWAEKIDDWTSGQQVVVLFFDGRILRQRRVNGPFIVGRVILYGATFEEQVENPYITAPYNYSDFSGAGSEIVGNYIESTVDENANGLLEKLNIAVDVNIVNDSNITIDGYLCGPDGNAISYMKAEQTLAAGKHVLTLTADGKTIRQSRANGPYLLRSLALYEDGNRVDFIYNAYQTQSYLWTDFEGGDGEFAASNTFNDQGVDLDGDGLFNILRIEMTVNISQEGQYALVGRLFDSAGESIDDVITQMTVAQGLQTFTLDFSGTKIRKHGLSGPYVLRYAFLYDSNGSLSDSLPNAYTTQAYQLWQFQMLLAGLTGNFTDEGRDKNSNGLFDELAVNVEVDAVQPGNVVVEARLESEDGTDLGSATNYATVSGGPKWVELLFDGKNIFASGMDGPYILTDVRAYHTGDPTQSEIVEDAYVTGPYGAIAFEPTAVIRGTVMNFSGQPIGGATISAGAAATYSTGLGEYYIGLADTGVTPVSIEAPANITTGTWYYALNGGQPIMGDTAMVDLAIGAVVHLDWVLVVDITPPEVAVVIPVAGQALQDGVIVTAEANDNSGVEAVYFYVREPNDGNGVPIGQEDLAVTFNAVTGKWELNFDTTQLPDGYYVVLAKAVDTYGNIGWSEPVPFSIRNWAIITLLPSTPNSKAGRTMPVKFALRIAASVDPAQPFVYNDELEIRIYKAGSPGTILQRAVFGSGATDYRIDMSGEKYITNFKTGTKPATYVVEIWRPTKNFLVGSFTFATVK